MSDGLEHKFHRPEGGLTARVAAGGGHEIAGYASLFGVADQGGDTVMPGAYAGSLARLAAAGGRVRMLWQHDPMQPIGIWEEVREDGRGLWVRGQILSEVAKGREAAALLAAGALDGLSIGYRTLRAERLAKGRRLLELELWEVSLVTFPMQAQARIAGKGSEAAEVAALLRGLGARMRQAREGLRGG